jgi:endoglucanase Acf2
MNRNGSKIDERTPLVSDLTSVEESAGNLNNFGNASVKNVIEVNSFSSSKFVAKNLKWFVAVSLACSVLVVITSFYSSVTPSIVPMENSAWASRSEPFSVVDPTSLGLYSVERTWSSKPGKVFGKLLHTKFPLPTNSWYQNLLIGGVGNRDTENKVFQVPYIIDTAGPIPGIRTHPAHVQANDRSVMVILFVFY